MKFAPRTLYPDRSEGIWVLYDLRDFADCERLHKARALLQGDSDLESLGPDHMLLKIFPGGAARLLP
jgi:hypothetical protein